jgi:hypothetical protein
VRQIQQGRPVDGWPAPAPGGLCLTADLVGAVSLGAGGEKEPPTAWAGRKNVWGRGV